MYSNFSDIKVGSTRIFHKPSYKGKNENKNGPFLIQTTRNHNSQQHGVIVSNDLTLLHNAWLKVSAVQGLNTKGI